MYLLVDILNQIGMSWVSSSSILFHSFEATILYSIFFFFVSLLPPLIIFYAKRRAKDRIASESGFVCENASYCYSKTYCKHSNRDSYSTAKMYSQAHNFKFIAEMISKIGILMLLSIKSIVCDWLHLFGHIDKIKEELQTKNARPSISKAQPGHMN